MTWLIQVCWCSKNPPSYRFSLLNVEFLYTWTTYFSVTLFTHKVFLQFYFLLIAEKRKIIQCILHYIKK